MGEMQDRKQEKRIQLDTRCNDVKTAENYGPYFRVSSMKVFSHPLQSHEDGIHEWASEHMQELQYVSLSS